MIYRSTCTEYSYLVRYQVEGSSRRRRITLAFPSQPETADIFQMMRATRCGPLLQPARRRGSIGCCARRMLVNAPNTVKDEQNMKGGGGEKKLTRWQQFKTTFREHGPVFVGYYGVTWLGWFCICYGAIACSGLNGVALLQAIGADAVFDTTALSPRVINALIAAEVNELADFVRLPIVIATTPALSRRLRGKPSSSESKPGSKEET